MTRRPVTNKGDSIRARLFNHAKNNGADFQHTLTRYAIERLLYRLSQAEARNRFFLKGAMLFATWPEHIFRPTGDLDLLGHGDSTPAAMIEIFTEICAIVVADDGISFLPETLYAEAAREDQGYRGITLSVIANLASARITVQVDIGFGDHVHPAPRWNPFPNLLPDLPTASLLMYPKETVVAEKFEAMVRFGEANSRIKDFYDIWVISKTFSFDLGELAEAIQGTFRRRNTDIPATIPPALLPQFAERPNVATGWSGFVRTRQPTLMPPTFDILLDELRQFFLPILSAFALPAGASRRWNRDQGIWEPPSQF